MYARKKNDLRGIFFTLSISFFCALLILSCQQKNKSSSPVDQTEKVDFNYLLGDWKRLNDKEGAQTFEHWVKGGALSYEGFSYTIENLDTIWSEDMQLVKINKAWQFQVVGKGERKATVFKVISIQENGFVCENQLNDFLKKIEYTVMGDQMSAVISDSEKSIPFNFERLIMNHE